MTRQTLQADTDWGNVAITIIFAAGTIIPLALVFAGVL